MRYFAMDLSGGEKGEAMAKYLVCVSDERHASYEIERAILEKTGAELKLLS